MEYILVRGGRPLMGEIGIHGAKNSVLPLLAGALLFRRGCILHNCPRLTDVDAALELLTGLGSRVSRSGATVTVEPGPITTTDLPERLMCRMRSSVLFLGPVLARTGCCSLTAPGGCCLGARPIDLHLSGLEAMGVSCIRRGNRLCCRGRLRGTEIILPFPSVGATENLILAALGAAGTTRIYNAAKEPEIGDLIGFLQAGGARIYGAGTAMLQIEGGLPEAAEYTVMPDRMESVTYLAAAAAAGGTVTLLDTQPRFFRAVTEVLEAAGCRIREDAQTITLRRDRRLAAVGAIRTAPYPGFPTDAQAPVMAAMLRASGVTLFQENIFSDRFRHVPALRAMGGRIRLAGGVAAVTGTAGLHGAAVEATDLRGGAAMVAAALSAEGESRISGAAHILRGYEDFPGQLKRLGADIEAC